MHEQDTPGYDDLHEAEKILDLVEDLNRRVRDLLGVDDDFDAFVGEHPELEELRYFDPAEEDALAAIDAKVTADWTRWSYRLRWHLADWLDRTLLPR